MINKEHKKIWDKAKLCGCGKNDCHPNNHRNCGICNKTIFYGAHESVEKQRGSKGAWNVDHIKPISKNGSNAQINKMAVHIKCNRNKGNKY